MRKKHALSLAIIFSLIILFSLNYFLKNTETELTINSKISRVLDGDTMELENGEKVRLININTPEKGKPYSQDAKNFIEVLVNETIEVESIGFDKYGRTLGRINYEGKYINLEIVRRGLGNKYLVQEDEIKEFKNAELLARTEKLGIWTQSEKFGCLRVKIFQSEDYLKIQDLCNLNFLGWTIKDESRHTYLFKNSFKSDSFIFNSKKGTDSKDEIFWNRGTVWKAKKNAIFVFDEKGLLVYYSDYGY